jgi:RND family efflux transporter MFP subunit
MNPLHAEAAVCSLSGGAARRFLRIRLLVATSAAVLGFTAISCKKEAQPPPPPPTVQVMAVTATNVPLHIEFIGQLDSPQNVEVRARVEGFVEEIPFAEGMEVKQGELLFKLDDRPYQQRLAAAKGGLAEAEAALAKYRADVARLTPLAEKRAVPKQDLDNALASVNVGEAGVLTAKARVEATQLDLSYCLIHAPTNGLIGAKQVSIGELVGKGTPTLMATLSTLDPIWFYCNISEVQYLRAQTEVDRKGKAVDDLPITLILSTGSEHKEKGKIVFMDRAVDVKTGTMRVRAAFPNPGGLLRPGMFARIKVDLGVRSDSILVPERAVSELQGRSFVWVIGEDNKATQRTVQVGESLGGNLVISEGLKTGERVVTEGLQKVREGAPVQPMTAAQMAEAAAQNTLHFETKHSGQGEAKSLKE